MGKEQTLCPLKTGCRSLMPSLLPPHLMEDRGNDRNAATRIQPLCLLATGVQVELGHKSAFGEGDLVIGQDEICNTEDEKFYLFGKVASPLWGVQDLIVEDREIEGQTEPDWVCRRQVNQCNVLHNSYCQPPTPITGVSSSSFSFRIHHMKVGKVNVIILLAYKFLAKLCSLTCFPIQMLKPKDTLCSR